MGIFLFQEKKNNASKLEGQVYHDPKKSDRPEIVLPADLTAVGKSWAPCEVNPIGKARPTTGAPPAPVKAVTSVQGCQVKAVTSVPPVQVKAVTSVPPVQVKDVVVIDGPKDGAAAAPPQDIPRQ